MKVKKMLAGIVMAAMGLSMTGFTYANLDTELKNNHYTVTDLWNLQDFLLAKENPDLDGKDYDLNSDGRCDAFDICLM